MIEQALQKLMTEGKVETIKQPSTNQQSAPVQQSPLDEFMPYLELLRYNKSARTTAPTKAPAGILNHFEFYDDGTNYRLYVYVNGTWRYTSLT